jgi:hypothetical protein
VRGADMRSRADAEELARFDAAKLVETRGDARKKVSETIRSSDENQHRDSAAAQVLFKFHSFIQGDENVEAVPFGEFEQFAICLAG